MELSVGQCQFLIGTAPAFEEDQVYTSVSHIHHQNEIYTYGARQLKIEENIQSINLGTDAIKEILTVQENRREAESDSKRNLWFGILSILVIFSALTDADSLFDIPFVSRFKNPLYFLVMGIVVVIAAYAIYKLVSDRFRRKK